MKVVFRVDASRAIGTGHARRSLSLARALRALGGEVAFVTRDLGLDCAAMISEAGFDRIATLPAPSRDASSNASPDADLEAISGAVEPDPAIPHAAWAHVSQAQDIDDTLAAAKGWSPDWVVVDSYAFDARWHRAVGEALGCKIAAIDDLADRAMACDLIIDHTHGPDHRAKYAGVLGGDDTRLLGGPRYGLLGPAFAEAPRYAFHQDVRSIGVFMGGVDADGHTARALDAIDAAGFDGAVEIVTTSANPQLCALCERVHARPKTTLSLDLPDLAAFFARHDIQIGAGGGASWERCCIGVPTLLVVVAANQNSVAPQLAAEGIVALAKEPSVEAIAENLTGLIENVEKRRALALKSRVLVDGRGAERVALALMAPNLTVRPATHSDARAMFDWRNHPSTRSVSGTQDELVWDEHTEWVSKALADPARHLFIGEIDDRAVGVIRFDFEAEARAEVSLYLDPDCHGLGLGPALLLAGEAAAAPTIIDATVLTENRASQRLFERCGYRQTGPTAWVKDRSNTKTTAGSDEAAGQSGLPARFPPR